MTASRKGGAVVEAAVVLPLIILSLITVILMMISMYRLVEDSVTLHAGLLREAGRESGTFSIEPAPAEFSSYRKSGDSMKGKTITPTYRGALLPSGAETTSSSAHIVREKKYIRKWDNALRE